MTTTQSIQDALPTGYRAKQNIGRLAKDYMGRQRWTITGPWGDSAEVIDIEQVAAAVARIDAAYAKRTAPAVEAPAPVAAQPAAPAARPARRTCRPGEHETDNNGRCYSCGAYVRGDDVASVFGSLRTRH